jgi:hypothetical protein
MSEHISIAELRAGIARKDVYIVGAPDEELLALVEAVEAAERYRRKQGDPYQPPVLAKIAGDALDDALRRFDFAVSPSGRDGDT